MKPITLRRIAIVGAVLTVLVAIDGLYMVIANYKPDATSGNGFGNFHPSDGQTVLIDGGVQQDRQQEAAPGVIEDPGEDIRHRHDHDPELDEETQVADEAGSDPIESWDEQVEGQVPQPPEDSEHQGAHQRTRALLQVWEREAAPACFLP